MNKIKLNRLMKQVESSKEKIAAERDKLWNIFGSIEDEIDSFNRGIEALDKFSQAINAFSEHV